MSAPPVPPRPYSAQGQSYPGDPNPPPLPPLPPDLRYDQHYDSAPHFENPLAAPRPHRLDPSIPANMARTLDDQLDYRSTINFSPGFAVPGPAPARGPSPLPPPQGANWSPWAPPAEPTYHPPPRHSSYGSPQPDLAFTTPPLPQPPKHQNSLPPQQAPAPARGASPPAPSITAPVPTLANLQGGLPTIQNPNHDPALRLAWARDVLFLVDKQQHGATSTDTPQGPVVITDPQLLRLSQIAVPLVLQIAAGPQAGLTTAEAIYLRATFAASGAYPEHVPLNARAAFRDFEAAARGGYASAWFRLGRDYENFNDVPRAKECFERGVKMGVESCLYRMGMANLMGQLSLPASAPTALPLLYRAALLATQLVPQPAYVYALLLLGEFSQLPSPLPADLFVPFLDPTTANSPLDNRVLLEARRHLERAAYLGFAPAQYKLGHAYEFAQPPYPFDALLSVQYYSLASQQGEVEADMALSKWFLCGSGDTEKGAGFEKDEALAWTFAEKAARRGLPSAEFAMGYYAEVGVGPAGAKKDLVEAKKWYMKAKDHGNADAAERLAALSQSSPQGLSRQEHDAITENKLVRKRTQAKQRSEAQGLPPSPYPSGASSFPNPARYQPPPQQPPQAAPAQGPGPGPGAYQQQQQQQQPHQPPPPAQHPYQNPNQPYQTPAEAYKQQARMQQQQQPPQRPDGRQVIEAVRRNSLLGFPPGPAPGQGQGPPQQGYAQQQAGRMQTLPENPPPPQQQQQQPYPNLQPYPQAHPHNSPHHSPQPQGGSPQPRPQRPGAQQYPSTQRYTLTDSPGHSPGPGQGPGQGQGGRKSPGAGLAGGRKSPGRRGGGPGAHGRMPSHGTPGAQGQGQGGPVMDIGPGGAQGAGTGLGGGVVYASKPGKGPATFAEMGFQGAKAEDKECVIM